MGHTRSSTCGGQQHRYRSGSCMAVGQVMEGGRRSQVKIHAWSLGVAASRLVDYPFMLSHVSFVA